MSVLFSILIVLVLVIAALVAFSAYVAARVERALPPTGHFIDIGADRIHYVEHGRGSPIVLVHGLGGQLLNFAYLDLPKLARSHRVILIDRPGAGYSIRGANSPDTIVHQAATVAAFIQALKLDKPLLVGHSLGGAIALAVGLNHPQSISRLALIAPLTHAQVEPPQAFRGLMIRSPLLRRVIAYTLATPLAIRKGPELLQLVFGPEPVPNDFQTRGGGLLGLRPNNFYAASSDMLATADDLPTMESRYGTLRMPVDILYGRQDQILDYRRHGEALQQKVPHAALKLVDGGHMLPVTLPAMTTDWLLAIADS